MNDVNDAIFKYLMENNYVKSAQTFQLESGCQGSANCSLNLLSLVSRIEQLESELSTYRIKEQQRVIPLKVRLLRASLKPINCVQCK